MFQSLSDKLQSAFRSLTGQARLSESNIADAMEQVREALLEADVNYEVVKNFVADVREACLGVDVHKSVTPGQQVIKIVNDKLTALMGEAAVPLELGKRHPSVIMMVGLHGSGKTTSSAKLAAHIRKTTTKRVLLVAADIYRPAAVDQLEVLGRSLDVPVFADRTAKDVAQIAREAVEQAKRDGIENVIIDTAGRFQIDTQMVMELVRVREVTQPVEILLVADAALGQEAVSVAKHFHEALGLTGIVLTKLDGDARGGAALSIRQVTGCPIKFIGTGEKIEDLEVFHPDRMASRILGMGDIVSLVEKTIEETDIAEMEKLQAKLKKSQFDFNDFLGQLRQMQKLGGLESILKFLPGGSNLLANVNIDPKQFARFEAMVLSMTPAERADPDLLDGSRRKRVAKGAGVEMEQVAQFVKQFQQMRKMMKGSNPMANMLRGGSVPEGPAGMSGRGLFSGGFRMPGGGNGSNYTPPKKKRKKR